MASLANSDDEENLALALRLSRLSSDDFDLQIAQLPGGSASANNTSRPRTPTNDEADDLALALRILQLPSDDFDAQIARLHHMGSASTSEEAHSPIPPNQSDKDDVGLALILSQLPADIVEQVRGLNQRREFRTAIDDGLASLLTPISLVQVRMTPPLCLANH
jgi:hypothetical protein